MSKKVAVLLLLAALSCGGQVHAQASPPATPAPAPPPPYGPPIGIVDAKKAAAAARRRSGQGGVCAGRDRNRRSRRFPDLLRAYGQHPARLGRNRDRKGAFRRPSKVFEDALAGGRMAILALHGAIPLEGGVPVISGGKLVGAIGASGGTGPQDGQVAKAEPMRSNRLAPE